MSIYLGYVKRSSEDEGEHGISTFVSLDLCCNCGMQCLVPHQPLRLQKRPLAYVVQGP